MSKKFDKAIKILENRVRELKTQIDVTSEKASWYHELREEHSAMKRILHFIRANYTQDGK